MCAIELSSETNVASGSFMRACEAFSSLGADSSTGVVSYIVHRQGH